MKKQSLIAGIAVVLIASLSTLAAPAARAITKINIARPAVGANAYYTFADSVVTLTRSDEYVITGASDRNRVVVGAGVTATVTLSSVSITSAVASPFALDSTGCDITLRIVGENTLAATMGNGSTPDFVYAAAVQVEGSASLTIDGDGSLIATGGYGAAAIGSGYIEGNSGHITGNITIAGGNLTLNGGTLGAGIGGGYAASVGNITITGGVITTTGGAHGTGIGGGEVGTVGNILITGGSVTATGGSYAAGIGGGYGGDNTGAINITGGSISITGGYGGAGIGGGPWNSGSNVSISGGVVLAVSPGGNGDPAGIGGGQEGNAGNISITGGNVYAFAYSLGPGIGGGTRATGGNITISGGNVVANKIGIGNAGGLTPTTVSGDSTAIIVGSINTDNFGTAKVQTGVSLSLEMMQAMAANAFGSAIVYNDTLYVHDTIVHNSAVIVIDTLEAIVHDTIIDSLHVSVEVIDTIRFDTITVVDTLYVHDTIIDVILRDSVTVIDSVRVPVTIIETIRIVCNIVDSALPIDTLFVSDTLVHIREKDTQVYILIDPTDGDDIGTGVGDGRSLFAQSPTRLIHTTADGSGGGNVLLEGLTPHAPFALYTVGGQLLLRGVASESGAYLLPNLPSGVYLLRQAK